MAKVRIHIRIFWIACILHSFGSFAQETGVDCAAVFSNAEIEFSAGRFYSIPSLLKGCIEADRFSNEQKVRVYELLAQVYLLTDQPLEAENSYLALLAADPEFVATEEKDPIDVVYLSKKFTTTPIFTPHYKAGATLSNYVPVVRMNTFSTPDSVNVVDSRLPGWTLGGGIEWNINENLGIGGEVFLTYKSYRTTATGIAGDDELVVTEKQTWFDIPLYVRYGYHLGTFRPYAYAGYSLNLLVGNKVTQRYTNNIPGAVGEGDLSDATEGPDDRILYKRKFLNRAIVVGGGVKYKRGKNFFLLDVRYMAGQGNATKKGTDFYTDAKGEYVMDPAITKYSNVGDFFRVNNWTFTVGYVVPLYDPRKIKKPRTKSVSRKLSKQGDNEK